MPEYFELYQTPVCPGGTIYTILPGDAFYLLARRFNVSVNAIIAANPGVNPNNLQIGQRICIPAPSAGACPGGFLYVIRSGDTYFTIAQRFGTVIEALIAANPGVDPNRLAIGQIICVPAPRPTPAPTPTPTRVPCPNGQLYTIRSGDTLFEIAARFNTTVEAILRANPGMDPNRLFIGQVICVPFPIPTPTPRPTPTPTQVPCPNGRLYTIRTGDTLFDIATRFNTTVEAILRANPGIDPNRLFIGQVICVPFPVPTPTPRPTPTPTPRPTPTPTAPPCAGGQLYTIRAGDTLLNIARRFNITVDDILEANPGLVRPIRIGQVICIPVPVPTPTPTLRPTIRPTLRPTPTPIPCPNGQLYTIRAGDTLFSIARMFNTTPVAILAANPQITSSNDLRAGQIICIPA